MGNNKEYHRALYRSRVAQHRCVRCGQKLPPEQEKKRCGQCAANQTRWAHDNEFKPAPRLAHESPRWRDLERSQGRCGVCGLLEPHECLNSYSGLASSRPGPREAGLYTMKHPRGQ